MRFRIVPNPEFRGVTEHVEMKLSVYIPCYNAASYLERALTGLLNQTRPPDEILIIDDGSTDNTAEVASRFPVKVIRHPKNKGLASATNTPSANATSELVAPSNPASSP